MIRGRRLWRRWKGIRKKAFAMASAQLYDFGQILFASSQILTVLCVTALVQARNLLIYKLINLK